MTQFGAPISLPFVLGNPAILVMRHSFNPQWILPLLTALLASTCNAAPRLKDLVSIEGVRDNQLVGYGVVVGLNGTGDKRQAVFSAQSLTTSCSAWEYSLIRQQYWCEIPLPS